MHLRNWIDFNLVIFLMIEISKLLKEIVNSIRNEVETFIQDSLWSLFLKLNNMEFSEERIYMTNH